MLADDSVRNFGLRVGRLFGIDIWLHWILLAIVALRLLHVLLAPVPEGFEKDYATVLTNFATFVVALLVSILLHEFGHAYAAYRQGGSCERIVLWPLGGLAYCDAPRTPRAQFVVAAGGPAVTLAIGIVAMLVCLVAGWPFWPFAGSWGFAELLFQQLFLWNTMLGVVNLVPCYPLDGGKMFHTWLWARMGSHNGALWVTLNVSRVTAIVALVFGGVLFFMGFTDKAWSYKHPFLDGLTVLLVFCGLIHFLDAKRTRMQLLYGETDEGGIFGYDFSRGYTSLEKSTGWSGGGPAGYSGTESRPSWRERRREEKRQRLAEGRRREDRELRQRLDEILEKISRDGMASLSRDERRFLERASKHVRESEARRD